MQFYVDILANLKGRRPVLYVGVTNNLDRRLSEHLLGTSGFVSRYRVTTLVYFEVTVDSHAAIEREKRLKGWTRARKIALIRTQNPTWRDLASGGKPSLRSG